MAAKKRGLGKGLEALLGSSGAGAMEGTTPVTPEQAEADGMLRNIPVELLQRGIYQPRIDMHPDTLEELANSIRAQGVVQPIVVRPVSADRYEIIAGERRWRAAQLAGLHEIPAVVRDVPDQAAMAMALIENIQREELNPMEEAMALHRLIEEFGLTHQQTAEAVGRSRASVSNLLRLLGLTDDVKRMLENGDLEMGHARALLALEGEKQSQVARAVVAKGLSVRETERLVKRTQEQADGPAKKSAQPVDPDIHRLEQELGEKIGARVAIQHGAKGKGKLVIQYNSLDELDGILEHIK
ncbi:MAG: ParB/RepB/Spo0J family partition protein [Gammaproteobacteria bacterium]|nr:ParB/RepB/Spo0J family partition protein [Gammaproteobacteria bacterium]MCW8840305.1 ParB/RepB/Spo0J family partition protein [Gammaproteobacteria bacterium]MCW8928421.1 ParB/RepB/Spo0J family partition protein [Gammaproteobacteria bacterium]MCW8972332.1 ParB/RepB/Spo0J family partition protein [Gammaproteobacteria bacterium]MCW8992280.1 ParB/RepB/Spo0J family partition protein [Gammaproteobacteria bacterium]